jgi:hypothetical protein
LEGVYVNDPTTDCNIFATCNAASPLGQALGLTGTQTVEVADSQLCNLDVPGVQQCPAGTNNAGAIVTDLILCQAPNNLNRCPANTDLEGVYVNNIGTDCNILATCPFNSPLGVSLGLTAGGSIKVADAQLCGLNVPGVQQCPAGTNNAGAIVTDLILCQAPNNLNRCPANTDLEGVYVNNIGTDCNIFARCPAGSNLGAGAIVTDLSLCNAATPAVQCPVGTDLAGIWVHPTATASCNVSPADISLPTNPQSQCLKCADLAVFASQNYPAAQLTASQLRGETTATTNVFTVCNDPSPATAFNTLIPGGAPPGGSANAIEIAFGNCLVDAAANPGASTLQGQALSLQKNSFTTDIQAQNEVPATTDIQAQNEVPATTDIQAQELQQQILQQLQAQNEIPASRDIQAQTEIHGFSLPIPRIQNVIP